MVQVVVAGRCSVTNVYVGLHCAIVRVSASRPGSAVSHGTERCMWRRLAAGWQHPHTPPPPASLFVVYCWTAQWSGDS